MHDPDPTCLDLGRLGADLGVDLAAAFRDLGAFYADLDGQLGERTAALALPCRRGCGACCHQSVFLTPLEFLYAWAFAQDHLEAPERRLVIERGLALFATHRATIEALEAPDLPEGERQALAQRLRFRCPLLGGEDACLVHPARELFARLFGSSFLAGRAEIYGCQWVADALAGRRLRLPEAEVEARRLGRLPLTDRRQVYPYYLNLFFGPG